ncbi:hypothetical protein [Novosphingobium sp.]|uniref:globin domain-containing protein n=1 Tax=Novosphingobium sp. TaxID=1874826 RepID=UPI003D0D5260
MKATRILLSACILLPVGVALTQTSCGTKTASGSTCVAPAPAPAAKAAPACASTMFATYKQAGFDAVNAQIVKLATQTSLVPAIGDSFQTDIVAASTARQTEFTTNLEDFLIVAFGGPNNYTGPSMVNAHAGLNITSAQYDAFITQVVVPALTTVGVASSDISNCFAPVVTDANFKAQFVTCQ